MANLTENIKNALYEGRTDIILSLLKFQNGNNTDKKLMDNRVDHDGTMLHIASKLENQDLTRALLLRGADVTIKNELGLMPINISSSKIKKIYSEEFFRRISQNDLNGVKNIILGGIDINITIPSLDNSNCMHWAAIFSSPEVINYLKDKGANINLLNKAGLTPLHQSLLAEKLENFKMLIKLGANPSICPNGSKYANQSLREIASTLNEDKRALFLDYIATLDISHCPLEHSDSDHNSAPKNDGDMSSNNVINYPQGQSSHSEATDQSLTHAQMEEHSFLKVLWPKPRKVYMSDISEHAFSLPPSVNICLISKIPNVTPIKLWEVWEIFRESFLSLGSVLIMQPPSVRRESNIVCLLDDKTFSKDQGYKLVVANKQIKLIAKDVPGMYYGISSLREILRASPDFILPKFSIIDWPVYLNRGILLDISTGRIPKIGYLTRMIDFLAGLKMNKIYLNHRFDVSSSSCDNALSQWQVPYSAMDILFLERYCQECCIQLVPAIDITAMTPDKDAETNESNYKCGNFRLEPVRQFLDSFTNCKEIYVGQNFAKALLDQDSSATNGSTPLASLLATLLGINNNQSIIIDSENIDSAKRGESKFFDVALAEKTLDSLGPDIAVGVRCGYDHSSKRVEALSEFLKQNGVTHTLCIDSVWGRSLAGNCKSDFPVQILKSHYNEQRKKSSLTENPHSNDTNYHENGSANTNEDSPQNITHIIPDSCSINENGEILGAIHCLWTNMPNFVDHLFSWPTILALSTYLWNGTIVQHEYYSKTLPYILSWHVFPEDVECVLSNTLLELLAIENDMNQKSLLLNYDPNARNCHSNHGGVGNDSNKNMIKKSDSFFYRILTAPDDIDLQNFTVEYFGKIVKILRKIFSNLISWRNKIEGAPPSPKPNAGLDGHPDRSSSSHKVDNLISNYICDLEVMTLACRLAKCLMIAGANPDPNQNNSANGSNTTTHFINPGLANINSIHKTDLANKLLDIIGLFKKNWLEHNLEDNLTQNVAFLETLFNKLVPPGTHEE
ncbi:uncharacterized protein LOC135930028 isoform X2 [Gordionus sp. m RMFG-2023]|uniref:uncharacterized protein LOC135930028 isoform X2 n=1 Tax=Gordionus sp. m RMFG-2023 TaxID=3053472 RepID=UPI0031FDED84